MWRKTRVWIQEHLRVFIRNVPCMLAPRAHTFQHVRVVPVHTGDVLNGQRGGEGEAVTVNYAHQDLPT